MADKILAKTEILGLLQQSKASNHWAATQLPGANFKTVQHIDAGTMNPNPDVQVDQFNTTDANGTHFESERFYLDVTSGLPTIPFSGYADKSTLAAFLVGAFQACSEAVGTPYLKTITAAGLTGTVNWANNSGYLFTLALDQGGSADDGAVMYNSLINNLTLSWDLNARGIARLVTINGDWVGNDLDFEQTLDGSWTNGTPSQGNLFNNTDTWTMNTLTIDSVDYSGECIRKVDLSVSNNITSNCKTTGGKANNYDWAPEYKMMVTLDYNDTTEKLLNDFIGKKVISLSWTNDPEDNQEDGDMTISSSSGYMISPHKIYNGDFIGVQLEIRFYSTAAQTPLTVYLTDTIDWAF